MDFFIGIWKVFFLLCSCNFCGCYKISCVGELLVDADIIPIGSTLTVQCSTYTSRCGRRFAIDFNGHTFYEETNCSRIKTQIVINQPKSRLLCRVKEEDGWHLVCGKDLTAGYPPGKPVKFSCVTLTHSEHVNCSLTTTTETYLPTKYTVTFVDETTSQYFKYGMNEDGSVSIPRSVFNETVTYQAHVSEHNALGNSHSNFTFSIWDSVIPSTPEITQIVFENGSLSPIIHWKSSEEPWASLKPRLRFREANDSQHWVLGRETELHAGRVLLQEALHPLMFYQFQLRVCVTSDNCSMWSHFFNITSPGIAPSRKLDVWREIKRTNTRGRQNVTVLWKPFTSEDYRGGLLGYRLSYHEDGKIGEVNCSARATQHTFQLPLNTAEINISAVTSAGSSPPAPVSLIHTGKPAPRITYAAPAAEGGVRLVWDVSHYSEGVKIQGFVVQWEHRAQQLQWKKLGKDFTSTLLEGMQAGILYNISLYTEEASGVSNPAFSQVYAKEEKPLIGPDVSVTTAGEKHILIHWIELDQDKRRGFITNYTIYLHRHKDKRLVQKKTLPHALSRSFRWELQSLQQSFDVLVSAWNSAGEGPKGNAATCYYHMTLTCGETSRTYRPVTDNTTDGMIAGFCLVAAVPIVILANLMYLKCVRQRMMKICMSMGVSWLFENLPKFDNSKAIKLLKDDSYGRWGPLPGDNDPPLTPIEEISTPSWERKDSYPTVLHEDVPETPTPGQLSIDCPYKPQLLSPSQRAQDIFECSEEEMKEEEEQFPLLISPSHVLHDFNWDLTFIPVIHGPLNSFLAVDGEVGSLSALENLLSPPQTATDKDRRVKEEERTEGTGDMGQNSCQTVIPNDIESCLRAPVFGSSPYSPQGVCDSFAKPEEL